MSYCYVCGQEKDKKDVQCQPISDVLHAHPRCFVAHQVFHVLNSGRPDECPCGEWAIDWVKSLRKYVKPSVADEVERVIALFTSKEKMKEKEVKSTLAEVTSEIKTALKGGFDAFTEAIIT